MNKDFEEKKYPNDQDGMRDLRREDDDTAEIVTRGKFLADRMAETYGVDGFDDWHFAAEKHSVDEDMIWYGLAYAGGAAERREIDYILYELKGKKVRRFKATFRWPESGFPDSLANSTGSLKMSCAIKVRARVADKTAIEYAVAALPFLKKVKELKPR